MSKSVLIVGGGIAGCTLALKLKERGIDFTLVDNHQTDNATLVAAGMVNPMNFKRMITCWNADAFLSEAIPFYQHLESKWNVQFFHPIKLAKLMNSEHELELWQDGTQKGETKNYISETLITEQYKEHFKFDKAVGEVVKAYQLDTATFLKTVQQELSEDWINAPFHHDELEIHETTVSWHQKDYNHVFFCEGMGITENPYFNHLPFKPTKGELIKVKSHIKVAHTIKKNIFFHPEQDGTYWVGATYNWKDQSWTPTQEGKEELVTKLDKIVNFDYEIVDHKAGVRPTVKDRRPYLGKHPEHSNLVVFNGLGTRGVLMAPKLADELLDHVFEDALLDSEVDIGRIL